MVFQIIPKKITIEINSQLLQVLFFEYTYAVASAMLTKTTHALLNKCHASNLYFVNGIILAVRQLTAGFQKFGFNLLKILLW